MHRRREEGGGGAMLLTAVVVFRTRIYVVLLLDGCVCPCPYEVGSLEAAVRQSCLFVSPCHDNTILGRASCRSCVLFVVHLHAAGQRFDVNKISAVQDWESRKWSRSWLSL
jgi:hypothetical protein